MADRAQSPVERRELILRLLAHRHDHLQSTRYAASGFVHRTDAHESCPDCLTNDRRMFGCETCHGSGYVIVRRDRDPYAVNKTTPYGLDEAAADRERNLDRGIATAARELARFPGFRPETSLDEIDAANERDEGWIEARKTMYRRYDFAALDIALDLLRSALPDVSPSSPRGLRFLEPRMPAFIRAPAPDPVRELPKGKALTTVARRQRDQQVRRMLRENAPAKVAELTGLSPSTVYAIRRTMSEGEAA